MRHPRESFTHENVKKIKAKVDYLPESILACLPSLLFYNILLVLGSPHLYFSALRTAFRRFFRTRKSATLKHLLQAGYLVRHLLPGKNITHFHAHFAHSPTSVAMFSSRLSQIPFSFTAHAKDIYTSNKDQIREKINLANFVVTCTEYNRQFLNNLDGGSGKIHRIYHGIDTSLFLPKNPSRMLKEPYTILTVARMTEKKGIPTVLRSVRRLLDNGYSVRYILVGDGDEKYRILRLIDELGLSEKVSLLGTRSHGAVVEQYGKADLFALGCEVASNGDRDGIPNVFLESMAMGVPIVATNISATPEVIKHEKTGLLVPPGNPDQMSRAMVRLLTDTGLRSRIIHTARELVTTEFNNKVLIEDLAEKFNNLSSIPL